MQLARPHLTMLSFDTPTIAPIAREDTDPFRAYRDYVADHEAQLRDRCGRAHPEADDETGSAGLW